VLRLNLNRKNMEKIFATDKDHVQKRNCSKIRSPISFDRASLEKYG
jgi:hypothetical protein